MKMAKLTQTELLEIFQAVKKEMKPYEKGTIVARFDIEGKYDLWSEKKGINTYGRIRDEVAFAAAIVQSTYVGFYFMPVYSSEEIKSKMPEELMKLLKGKACFHIKKNDPEIMKQIGKALKMGHAGYDKLGWI
ncbi:DUF1801 domain-containing protein [Taibaiella soli]|uniref:DUF1801 domain-containing protein n=2 Tax=Taibaiella soli TaxID=1649169 RepID=A0A2W2BA62_9BACT|nr:DUF1801 domain-containing protein [Taibaiella soli]